METFEGEPIDIELPSSVSGQHLVNFSLRVDASKRVRGRGGKPPSIRAEMTLPVHLRYPDTGCERRGEDCEEYAWVEVSKPRERVLSLSFSPVVNEPKHVRIYLRPLHLVPLCTIPVVAAVRPW